MLIGYQQMHITNMLMPKGYDASQTSVHNMNDHFVWCPKYRRPVLVGELETRLRALLEQKSKQIDCEIIALETMPDHVHIFVKAKPTAAPNRIVAALKGFTSHELRKEFPHLRSRLRTLWSRNYFVSTHSHVSSETIQKYIAGQKGI